LIFDSDIKRIKYGLRTATMAGNVALALQDEAIETHDREARQDGGINGLPPDVSDVLDSRSWHLLPHAFTGKLHHMRGSFPMATKVAGTVSSAKRTKLSIGKLFADKLDALRAEIHRPALHDSAPTPTKEAAAMKTSACFLAGCCVHGSYGRNVVAMHSQFNRAMLVQRFPKTCPDRAGLVVSTVVICAIGIAPHGPLDGGYDGPAMAVDVLANKWAHIGIQDLIPRGMTAQLLTPSVDGSLSTVSMDMTEVALTGLWQFESAWQFVRHLAKTWCWYLRFFELTVSPRAVGTVRPNRCVVREMRPWPNQEARTICFWRGCADIEKAKRTYDRKLAATVNASLAFGTWA
jgi:hypothetical protein